MMVNILEVGGKPQTTLDHRIKKNHNRTRTWPCFQSPLPSLDDLFHGDFIFKQLTVFTHTKDGLERVFARRQVKMSWVSSEESNRGV
jgi:hypothetical protein